MTPNTALAGFLRQAAQTQFRWGQFDCGLWLADWVRLARELGFDPAADLRGRYHDARSALAALGTEGIGSTVTRLAAQCGLDRTADLMRGDIGLVKPSQHGNRVTGAIRGGRGWWLLTPGENGTGISLAPDEAVELAAAWRV